MGTMTIKDGRWYLSFTVGTPSSSSSQTLNSYTLSTNGQVIDKDIRIEVNASTVSIGSSSSNYRVINSAGWYGKNSGSNRGTSYNIDKNVIGGLKFSGSTAYFTFSCGGKIATSNITFKVKGNLAYYYDIPDGYILKPGSVTTYMCKCATNWTSYLKDIVDNGYTWYVYSPSGNTYVKCDINSSIQISNGDNFYFGSHSEYTAGHYVRTPGGQYWISGYTTTYKDLYVNGVNRGSTSGTWNICAMCSSNSDNVVYVYRN